MKTVHSIHRRTFIKLGATAGAGLFMIGFFRDSNGETHIVNVSGDDSLGSRMNPYVFIDSTGKISLYNHRPEMGQGTFESIPMIIAEELEVEIGQITVLPSPANRALYGDQMVVGSRSMAGQFELMRKIGASARETLITAAANRWKVNREDCYALNAAVIHRPSGRKLGYGELADDASKLSPPQNPRLKDPKDFRIIGTSPQRQDIPAKTNGQAVFGIDAVIPNMHYASVERSPVFLGKVISFNETAARAVPGVKYVLKTQRSIWGRTVEAVAVVANNYWAALQGRRALNVVWDNVGLDSWNTETIRADYKKAAQQEGAVFENRGDVNAAYGNAHVKLEASYFTPYQAHAPMEPMNAIVYAKKDSCEYWGSTQNPNGFRSQLARQCNVPEDKVTIHYCYMGGAFGRRSLTDVVEEAADLSMKTGLPIQVVWTREDDISQGPFRACSLNLLRGALDASGNPVAFEHKVICQDIRNQTGHDDRATDGISGGITTEYSIPNLAVKGVLRKLHIPISYWRSVYHSTNCFAHESFIDEMAAAAKKDPLEFRLSMLKDHPRYTALLKTVAEASGWYKRRDANTGRGLAIVERSGTYVAAVAEIARRDGKIKPVRITVALDSGIVIHPDNLKAQTEGCVVMGLTAAYKSGISIDKGSIVEQNFHNFKLLQINECPEIEVILMKNDYPPQGGGEPGLPPVAPALTNAIFQLTGKRIRELPFNLDAV
ncbi:MAG TPA: molybdopterin cofactor-binding domain-containing protein [Puia sp.]|nr:molybdopterin cofactor-binding domain-containing protein [Puia sp.]